MRWFLCTSFLTAFACNNEPLTFRCKEDSQCIIEGIAAICVERNANREGVCAISDITCPSGYRFDESAGLLGKLCYVPGADLTTTVVDMAVPTDIEVVARDLSANDLSSFDLTAVDLAVPPTWKVKTAPPRPGGGADQLTSVWASGPTDVYVAGNWIYRTTDRAANWTPATFATMNPTTVNSIWGSSATDVYAGGAGSRVWRSTGNLNFVSLTVSPTLSGAAIDIWGSVNGADVFVAGSSGTSAQYMMKVSSDKTEVTSLNGTNQFPQLFLTSVCTSSGGGVVFAAASYLSGNIFKSTDGGVTFGSAVFSNANKTISGLWCSADGQTIVGVGSGGQIVRSTNGGTSFGDESVPTTGTLNSVHGVSASELWAVGSGGLIYHYQSGIGWTAQSSNTSKDLKGVHAISSTDVWAVGNEGTVLHYE